MDCLQMHSISLGMWSDVQTSEMLPVKCGNDFSVGVKNNRVRRRG